MIKIENKVKTNSISKTNPAKTNTKNKLNGTTPK
jgi:hypothetical protein